MRSEVERQRRTGIGTAKNKAGARQLRMGQEKIGQYSSLEQRTVREMFEKRTGMSEEKDMGEQMTGQERTGWMWRKAKEDSSGPGKDR